MIHVLTSIRPKRFIVSLLILSAAACNLDSVSLIDLRVQGTVTDVETTQPIAGAIVELFEVLPPFALMATATTDAQGRYSLAASSSACLDGQGLLVEAGATGYAPSSRQVDQCNEAVQTLDLALTPSPVP